jgi:transposase-like protein
MTDITQLRRYLADIPTLMAEAQHYITPGTAPQDPDARHSTTIYRIPIVAEIVDLLDKRAKDVDEHSDNRNNGERRLGILPTLGLWVSLTFVELEDTGHSPRICCPSRRHTVVGECDWLSEYAEPILQLHPDFYTEIETIWKELRQACRVRREYTPRCNHFNNPVEAIHGNDNDGPAWWRCTGCSRTWVHDAEVQRLALTQPPMTLRQIATLLGLPLRTLHNWRSQGRFTTDSRGKTEVEHVKRAARTIGREVQESA